jgi:SAM-dependent methyltransferase
MDFILPLERYMKINKGMMPHPPDLNASCAGYDQFAWLFDEQWGDFAVRIFPAVAKMVAGKIPPNAKILDLCCGTGQLARLLTEKGYQVTGLDGSAAMLQLARKNAPQAEFILADARAFQFSPFFAAVFSTYDSLNHLLSLKDLQAAFRNVFDCLLPGGIFVFDLNTLKAYRNQWEGYLDVVEKPEYLYVNQAHYNARDRTGFTHCTIFHREGEIWRRSDVRLYQKFHPLDSVESLLQRLGFTRIRQYALDEKRGYHTFTEEDVRVFFACRKPETDQHYL